MTTAPNDQPDNGTENAPEPEQNPADLQAHEPDSDEPDQDSEATTMAPPEGDPTSQQNAG